MLNSIKKKFLFAALAIIGVAGVSATVFLSQQQQDTRSRAAASTTLNFTPTSSASSPINAAVNQAISLDVIITPGNNKPSLVKLELLFDPTKFTLSASPFLVNTNAFPVTQEGPSVQNGKILISVSVGNDPSKAISQTTKVGTLNLIALNSTGSSPSQVSFGTSSQVLSVASGDQATENVLSVANPAFITVAVPATPTPTNIPTPTPAKKGGNGGDGGNAGTNCPQNSTPSTGSKGSIGSNTTGGTGGTGGTGCSGVGSSNQGGIGGLGGFGSFSGPGSPGANGEAGKGVGSGGGGGGGAPGQPGGKGGDGGPGCGGPGEKGLPGEPAPNAWTGGIGGKGGAGGPGCSPTITPIPTATPTVTPTIVPPANTKLNLNLYFHGIGNSGDNANPNNHSLSNKNPLTKSRNIEIQILNAANTIIASANANVAYDTVSGSFKGIADFGTKITTGGTYNVKVKSTTQLRKLIPGLQNINPGANYNLPSVHLVAGDINNDNALNILDYNILVGCYSDFAPAKSCTTTNKPLADLNDNGSVNQHDYNLFLREISVQAGE